MKEVDAIVVGAGPAGAEAAITAGSCGLDVLLFDEATAAGGQVYRAGPEADLLRKRLSESGSQLAFEHRVWTASHLNGGEFEVASIGPKGSLVARASALIIATGAVERFYPRPGWTLPGVIGLGAATLMIKAHNVLPGRRVLVAGPGPLALLVAHLILSKGGTVVAVTDPNPLSAWLRALPAMTSRPDLLMQGGRWMAELAGRRVPVLRGWDMRRIDGNQQVESVTIGNEVRQKRFAVDAVCFGDGLVPSTEFYRLLNAELEYDAIRGGWVPILDDAQQTTIKGLYGVGDGAALCGVGAAPLTGRIAAFAVAHSLGKLPTTQYREQHLVETRSLQQALRFGREMVRMVQPRAAAMRDVPEDTIVCRCEDLSLKDLRTAIEQGSCEINALKAATRCGMGPCGGRICGEAAAAAMESTGLTRQAIGYWTSRPPIRPISIEALTGDFDYADIPVSEPAPL
jgi:thioredoxin reductase